MSKTYLSTELLVQIPVPLSMLGAVYALLGGVSAVALAAAPAKPASVLDAEQPEAEAVAVEANGATGEIDAAGTPFDPARHTGTKVKSGLWRLKTGMARLPGEELPAGSPNDAGAAASSSGSAAAAGTATGAVEEDDEFAQFAAAAAPASAKARTWTDADLSKLANQAATKLGSPDKVKATIAKHVPEGLTPHSRNIPADKREAFATDLETVAGIEYAG